VPLSYIFNDIEPGMGEGPDDDALTEKPKEGRKLIKLDLKAVSKHSRSKETTTEKFTPSIATPDKLGCYTQFRKVPVIVEGPEFMQDLTYFLVHGQPDLRSFEKGILLEDFSDMLKKRNISLEFRVMQRMT